MHPDDNNEPPTYPAEKARQGRIILRTPAQRFVFIAGLACLVILMIVVSFFGRG